MTYQESCVFLKSYGWTDKRIALYSQSYIISRAERLRKEKALNRLNQGLDMGSGNSLPGATGILGTKGATGFTGATGFGFTGSSGIGYAGATGLGLKGATGLGLKGATGFTGATGLGYIGSTGIGVAGSTGIGYIGSTGSNGTQDIIFGYSSPDPITGNISAINLIQKVSLISGASGVNNRDPDAVTFSWNTKPLPGDMLIIISTMNTGTLAVNAVNQANGESGVGDCWNYGFEVSPWPRDWVQTIIWKIAGEDEPIDFKIVFGGWTATTTPPSFSYDPANQNFDVHFGIVGLEMTGLSAPDVSASDDGGSYLNDLSHTVGPTPTTTDPNELIIAVGTYCGYPGTDFGPWVTNSNQLISWALSPNLAPLNSLFGTINWDGGYNGDFGNNNFWDVGIAVVGATGNFSATATWEFPSIQQNYLIATFKSNGTSLSPPDDTLYINPVTNTIYGPYNSLGATGSQWPVLISGSGGSGSIGATGFIGATGVGGGGEGSIGATGFIGATGTGSGSGNIGATGLIGSTGFGYPGSTGPSGGPIGATGIGFTGATGIVNSTDISIFIGASQIGAINASFIFGATGFIGSTGLGATGFTGATGIGGGGSNPPCYLGPGGYGDRRVIIPVTNVGAPFTNDPGTLVGPLTNNIGHFSGGAVTGYFQFDFGVSVIIDEMIVNMQYDAVQGVWKWQGSSDGITFVDIGSSFTIATNGQHITEINGNTIGYRYFRLTGISGVTSSASYMGGFNFRTAFA